MDRKANKKTSLKGLVIFGLIIAVIGVVIYVAKFYVTDPFRTVSELPFAEYRNDSMGVRGNIYKFTGIVENQLGWSQKDGRLFSFRVESNGEGYYIAVLFSTDLAGFNVQKGQKLEIKVKVVDKGVLQAL